MIIVDEVHAGNVDVEPIQRDHANTALVLTVVFLLNSIMGELVKCIKGLKAGVQCQEPIAKATEEALYLALGGAIADGSIREAEFQAEANRRCLIGTEIGTLAKI